MSFQPYKTQTARQKFRPRAALSQDKGKETTTAEQINFHLKDLTAILLIHCLTKICRAAAKKCGLTATNKQQRGHC